ncbi:MAG: alpha/beta hydrolase [Limnobacter sp.]|nr:alpha/beta hydrolase [Limnobacter sp.]
MSGELEILRFENEGVPLQAILTGATDGPWVVLIHGFPDTPYNWSGVAKLLGQLGYRVAMPWLRGYTEESASKEFEYGVMPAVRDLTELMRALGNPPAHVVGHDWGSIVASVHANSQVNTWTSVSLLAVPPFEGLAGSPWKVLRTLPAQLKRSSYMWEMQKEDSCDRLAANHCEAVRTLWKEWSPGWEFTDSQFDAVKDVFSKPLLGWAATRYYRSLFTLHKRDTWLTGLGAMGRLVHPVLALSGEKDGCMGKDFQEAMFGVAESNPLLRTHLVPGCGHFLQAERPAEVAALLHEHFQLANARLFTTTT